MLEGSPFQQYDLQLMSLHEECVSVSESTYCGQFQTGGFQWAESVRYAFKDKKTSIKIVA